LTSHSHPTVRIALIAAATLAAIRVGGPALIIGLFTAALLVLDCLIPDSPAAAAADADAHFDRLVRRRRRDVWLGRSAPLEVLDIAKGWTALAHRRGLGVQAIDVRAVAGTIEPAQARQFDRELRPDRSASARWKTLWLAYRRGDAIPAVSVYRVDGRHWLSDGHHRLSVLRAQGTTTVDADIVELVRTPGPSTPDGNMAHAQTQAARPRSI